MDACINFYTQKNRLLACPQAAKATHKMAAINKLSQARLPVDFALFSNIHLYMKFKTALRPGEAC